MQYKTFSDSLVTLVHDTKRNVDPICAKVELMQHIYLQKHSDLYSTDEKRQIQYYLKAVLYKFQLSACTLEQLWSMSHSKRDDVYLAIANGLDRLDCTDEELLAVSLVFEEYLFIARSFLDFYMLYLCLVLKTGHEGSISLEKFYSSLKRSNIDRLVTDVSKVDSYFQTKVFAESSKDWLAPENWGALIKSLRDKISHRDIIKRSFDSEETLLDAVTFDWPTLRGMTYDRFCQYMENGMFTMLTNVSSIIYGLEWIPGVYNSDMYNNTRSVKG